MAFPEPLPAEPKKNRTGLIIGVVVAILCCCCLIGSGLGYYLYQNGDVMFGTGALMPIFAAL